MNASGIVFPANIRPAATIFAKTSGLSKTNSKKQNHPFRDV